MTRRRYSHKFTVAALAVLAASCGSNNAQNSGSGGSRPSAGGASGGAAPASSGGQVGTGGSAPGVGGKGSGGSMSGGAAGSASGGSGSGGATSGAGGSSSAATGGSSTGTGGMAGGRSGGGGDGSGGSSGGATVTGGATGTGGTGGSQSCPILPGAPTGTAPLPSAAQLSYQRNEMTAFIHYGLSTYDGSEQCNPSDSPSIFNPTKLDATSVGQWVSSLQAAGFGQAMLVTKHSVGFTLWPSKYTDYSVKSSPWMNGHADSFNGSSETNCQTVSSSSRPKRDRRQAVRGASVARDFHMAFPVRSCRCQRRSVSLATFASHARTSQNAPLSS